MLLSDNESRQVGRAEGRRKRRGAETARFLSYWGTHQLKSDCERRYVLVVLNHEIRVSGFQLFESVKCVDEEYGEGAESMPKMEMNCACQLWAQPSDAVFPFLVQRGTLCK